LSPHPKHYFGKLTDNVKIKLFRIPQKTSQILLKTTSQTIAHSLASSVCANTTRIQVNQDFASLINSLKTMLKMIKNMTQVIVWQNRK
jgi:hypothetical protein